MKIIIIIAMSSLFIPTLMSAEIIYFKDGTKVESDRVWYTDTQVKCELNGIEFGFPKKDIKKIEGQQQEKSTLNKSTPSDSQLVKIYNKKPDYNSMTDDELIEQASKETGISKEKIEFQFNSMKDLGEKDRYNALILSLGMIKHTEMETKKVPKDTAYRSHPRYTEVHSILKSKGLSSEEADIYIRDMVQYGTMPK